MKKKSEIEERMVQKRGKQGRRDTLRSRRVFAKAAGEQRPMLRHQARSARTGGNDLKKGTRDASRQWREPPGLPSESLKDPAFEDPHVQLCLQTTMEKKKKKAVTLGHQILNLFDDDFVGCCEQLIFSVFTPRGIKFRWRVAGVPEEVPKSAILPRI